MLFQMYFNEERFYYNDLQKSNYPVSLNSPPGSGRDNTFPLYLQIFPLGKEMFLLFIETMPLKEESSLDFLEVAPLCAIHIAKIEPGYYN